MWIPLTVHAKTRRTFGALIDTGASVTVLSNAYAEMIGIDWKAEDKLEIGGFRYPVCYRRVDMHIPRTDCFVENLRVAVIATPANDIPGAIIGADFLQRPGAVLDVRKGRHAVGGDLEGRDANPPELVRAKPLRVKRAKPARRRNGRS